MFHAKEQVKEKGVVCIFVHFDETTEKGVQDEVENGVEEKEESYLESSSDFQRSFIPYINHTMSLDGSGAMFPSRHCRIGWSDLGMHLDLRGFIVGPGDVILPPSFR
jgi:hypothetical protein